jgi:hypothetical protein
VGLLGMKSMWIPPDFDWQPPGPAADWSVESMQAVPPPQVIASPDPRAPMLSRRVKTAFVWIAAAAVCLAAAAGIAARWIHVADQAREELLRHQREAFAWSREELTAHWGDKLSWHPDAGAETALAVTPRSLWNDFDAIYILYRDNNAVAVLALTQVGGYFNLEPIRAREWPETLIPRRLSAGERADLNLMIESIEDRLSTFDPQSNRSGWNRYVLSIARELAEHQAAAVDETPPNPPSAGRVQ